MKFDEFDNGTGEAIRALKRENTLTWLFAVGLGFTGIYFTPTMSEGEQAIFAVVLGVGAALLQEVRRVRIDALRMERQKLYEAFSTFQLEKERGEVKASKGL